MPCWLSSSLVLLWRPKERRARKERCGSKLQNLSLRREERGREKKPWVIAKAPKSGRQLLLLLAANSNAYRAVEVLTPRMEEKREKRQRWRGVGQTLSGTVKVNNQQQSNPFIALKSLHFSLNSSLINTQTLLIKTNNESDCELETTLGVIRR